MHSGQSSGEPSSCGQENGVASSDPDRPHKKARFPWQIKGKHHLKNQTNEVTESTTATPIEPEPITPSVTMSNEISFDRSTSSLKNEVTTNSRDERRLIWHGSGRPPISPDGNPFLPLETVVSLAESMLMRSIAGGSNCFDTARDAVNTLLELELEAAPSSPISPRILAREARRSRRAEDKAISRWQAAQTVKGCFDNTVNSVLDSWITASHPAEERSIALSFARIMNDLPPNDDNVENEGILMAINAHGLQNVPTVAGIPLIAPTEQLSRTLASDIPICEDSDSSICSEDFEFGRYSSEWPLDEPDTRKVNESGQSDEEIDNVGHSWRQIHANRHATQPAPYQYRDNSTTGEDYEYEFMNTAVIQAIKSKGLMAAGTDFG